MKALRQIQRFKNQAPKPGYFHEMEQNFEA